MKQLLKALNKIILITYDILENISALVIAAEMIIVTTGIVFRYFLKHPLGWIEEICILMLIYLAYLTAGMTTVSKTHIVADFISSKIKGTPKKIISWIIRVCEIVFLGVLVFGIVKLLPNMTAKSTVLEIPRVWYYFPIGVISIYMIFAIIVDMLNEIFPGYDYWRMRQDQREQAAAEAEQLAAEEALRNAEEFLGEVGGNTK